MEIFVTFKKTEIIANFLAVTEILPFKKIGHFNHSFSENFQGQ